MIPAQNPIIWNKTYIHINTGMAYVVIFIADDMKAGDTWLGEGVVIYRRLGEPKTFARLESDFRKKFNAVA